jgi:chemotaxis protein methyltransferase WspC
MNRIQDLLREVIGLHAATVGPEFVNQAIEAGMRRHGLRESQAYLALLQKSPAAWNSLVESVVVAETWFLRDREVFRAFANLVKNEWLPRHPSGVVRVLSAPCSTGEEAYSIAMTLMESNLPSGRFCIYAQDISPLAIARAQRAEYGNNSFRGKDLDFRAWHFQAIRGMHKLNLNVQKNVRFQVANLLNDAGHSHHEKYDFIFCRNLLIYFDRPTQARLLKKLKSWLTDTGVLFVGAAEVPIAARNGFAPANIPFSFACRKTPETNFVQEKPRRPHPAPAEKKPPEFTPLSPPALAHEESAKLHPGFFPPVATTFDESTNLQKARRLAEQGQMTAATGICESYLRENGVSAQAFYLLGLMRNAAGSDLEASEYYRKALYLEPNHYDTLIQWASLAKKNGDLQHAQLLSGRAERLKRDDLKAS